MKQAIDAAVAPREEEAAASKTGDAEEIERLAKLDPLDFDRQCKGAAKKLGVSVEALKRAVAERRHELAAERETGFLVPVEPWHEPVDGEALLDALCEIIDRHIIMPKGGTLTTALWILHAHAHDAARHSPILFINSPTKRCGKTNLLEALSRLVPKSLSAANVTPATIFRTIDRWKPTMLIDETDTFLSDKSELRGILNSGHTRSQACVIRCVGDDLIPKPFSTWAPKAFAAIGRMHPTLEDRSIPIELKRKLKAEKVSRLPKNPDAYLEVQRKCARWATDNLSELQHAEPQLPEQLNDRARDSWEPLLAIADACGGDWPSLARDAAVRLSGVDDDEEFPILLLDDLRLLFRREQSRNLASKAIEAHLTEMEDRPWPEYRHGKPITARQIAKLLKPFKIYPRQVLVRGERVQGYAQDQFKWAFQRYLPPDGDESSASSEKPSAARLPADNQPLNDTVRAEDKNRDKALEPKAFQRMQRMRQEPRAKEDTEGRLQPSADGRKSRFDFKPNEQRARRAAKEVAARRAREQV